MRVLVDTNVILDSMLQRLPWHNDTDAILRAAAQGEVTCAATSLSLAIIFYVGRRIVGNAQARVGVRHYLAAFDVLPVNRQTLEDADALPGEDLEDSIQIAAAVAAGLDGIVTRDANGFTSSLLPVWTPADFLTRVLQSPQP